VAAAGLGRRQASPWDPGACCSPAAEEALGPSPGETRTAWVAASGARSRARSTVRTHACAVVVAYPRSICCRHLRTQDVGIAQGVIAHGSRHGARGWPESPQVRVRKPLVEPGPDRSGPGFEKAGEAHQLTRRGACTSWVPTPIGLGDARSSPRARVSFRTPSVALTGRRGEIESARG